MVYLKFILTKLRSIYLYFIIIIIIICLDAQAAEAQFCWEGSQLPKCKIFPLLETSAYLGGSDLFAWEYGTMLNLNQQYAFGVSLWAGTRTYKDSKFRLRFRRWLSESLTIDLSTGNVLLFTDPKLAGELNLNYDDRLILSFSRFPNITGRYGYFRGNHFEHYIGVKAGTRFFSGVGAKMAHSPGKAAVIVVTSTGVGYIIALLLLGGAG